MPELSPEVLQSLAAYGPIIFIVLIFYFLLYRPQKKEQQRRNEMLNGLKKGDRVITIGGVYGTIISLTDKTITLKISEKVEVEISRTAVSSYQNPRKNDANR